MKEYKGTKQKYIENHRINEDGLTERKCTSCEEWKLENTDNFYMMNKQKPEKGFQAECKPCISKRSFINENKDRQKAKEYKREYYLNNKDSMLGSFKRRYREKNDEWKIYMSEYQRNNPDKMKIYNENRQHKNHKISKKEWMACKEYFDNQCAYCGLPINEHYVTRKGIAKLGDFHKEHVDHEGENDLSNCIPSCKNCNSEKHTKKLDEWYNSENPKFLQERIDKIIKWISEDYKQYIKI